jgi:hypothetical protein
MSVVECDVPRHSVLGKDLIERADFRDAYFSGVRSGIRPSPRGGRSAHPATRGLPAVARWPPDDVDARRDLHPLAAVLLSIRWGSLVGFAVRFLSAGVPGHVACKPEGL